MKKLLYLKTALIPMIIFIFIISIFFMIRGVWITVEVTLGMLKGDLSFVHYSEENIKHAPSLMLLEAVDSFLLSFVFFVFSMGLYKIFFLPSDAATESKLPGWLHVASIFELKSLLWHSVLTSLVVLFLNYAVIQISANHLNWTFLVFPGSIVLVSGGLFLMKKAENHQ